MLVTVVAGDLGAVDAGDAQVLAVVLQLTHDGAEGSHDQGHGTLGLYCTSAFLVVVVVQLLVVVVFVVIVGVLALITFLAEGGSHYLGNTPSQLGELPMHACSPHCQGARPKCRPLNGKTSFKSLV